MGERSGPAVVRQELPEDLDAIHALHAGAFPTGAEAALVDALRNAGRLTFSLVAVEGAQVVGHVAFSPITVNGQPAGLGLAPVAVRADCRGRGIAAQLIRDGLELCRACSVGLVVVLGDPAYYARFGFEPARRYALRDEYEGGAAFQAIELERGAAPAEGGLVQYAPEFARFSV